MMAAAIEMASDIAGKSPVAVQGTKVNLNYARDHSVQDGLEFVVRSVTRGDRKSQIKQCLGFCTADFWSSLTYESAEQKPKHCLT